MREESQRLLGHRALLRPSLGCRPSGWLTDDCRKPLLLHEWQEGPLCTIKGEWLGAEEPGSLCTSRFQRECGG